MNYPRPSGWKDGGAFWTNDKGRFGMRYMCKTCGSRSLGSGSPDRMHGRNCPHRAEFDRRELLRRLAAVAETPLGRNLAIAGALDRAFVLGSECGKRSEAERGFWDSPPPWVPNLDGKAAP